MAVEALHWAVLFAACWVAANFLYVSFPNCVYSTSTKECFLPFPAIRIQKMFGCGDMCLFALGHVSIALNDSKHLYRYTDALKYTTPASATTLSSTSSGFVLVGGALFGTERATKAKVIAVFMAMAGTVLIADDDMDSRSTPRAMLGDVLALCSALVYSGYLLLFGMMIGEAYDTEAFLAVVGTVSLFLLPLASFEQGGFLIPNPRQFFLLSVNAVLGTALSQRLWLYGSLKCGGTTATLAMALAIPCAAVVDIGRGEVAIDAEWCLGAVLIGLSFFLIARVCFSFFLYEGMNVLCIPIGGLGSTKLEFSLN